MGAHRTTSEDFFRRCLLAAALTLFVAIVYAPSLKAGFIYDDVRVILRQAVPESLSDIFEVFAEPHYEGLPYYRPVTRLTFLVQKLLHGDDPLPFHLFNVLLIAGTACWVFVLLQRPAFAIPPELAALAAAVFTVHPVASSCVYPIASGRETLLPVFFMIGALDAFLRSGRAWRIAAIALFGLALFSKEQAVILLPLLVVADLLGLSEDAPAGGLHSWVRRYWPFILIEGAYFVVRGQLFAGTEYRVAGHPALVALTPIYAMQMMITPFVALVYEPVAVESWLSPVRVLVGLSVLSSIIASGRRGWAGVRRPVFFWVSAFFLSLLPTANIFEQDTPYDERYVYLGLLSFVSIAALVLARPWSRSASRWQLRIAALLVITCCAAITLHRGVYFRDDEAFHRQWARTSPGYFLPHHNLAAALYARGKTRQAERQYLRSIELNPRWPDSYLNLAIIYLAGGRYDRALGFARRYADLKPDSAKAQYSLALVLQNLERNDEAMAHYLRTLELDPMNAEAHNNLGVLYDELGQTDQALMHYRAALAIDPGKEGTRRNIRLIEERNPRDSPAAGGEAPAAKDR